MKCIKETKICNNIIVNIKNFLILKYKLLKSKLILKFSLILKFGLNLKYSLKLIFFKNIYFFKSCFIFKSFNTFTKILCILLIFLLSNFFLTGCFLNEHSFSSFGQYALEKFLSFFKDINNLFSLDHTTDSTAISTELDSEIAEEDANTIKILIYIDNKIDYKIRDLIINKLDNIIPKEIGYSIVYYKVDKESGAVADLIFELAKKEDKYIQNSSFNKGKLNNSNSYNINTYNNTNNSLYNSSPYTSNSYSNSFYSSSSYNSDINDINSYKSKSIEYSACILPEPIYFALATSYFSLIENISWQDFLKIWEGENTSVKDIAGNDLEIVLSLSDKNLKILESYFGKCLAKNLIIENQKKIDELIKSNTASITSSKSLNKSLNEPLRESLNEQLNEPLNKTLNKPLNIITIVPFDKIEPYHKVILIDNKSVLDKKVIAKIESKQSYSKGYNLKDQTDTNDKINDDNPPFGISGQIETSTLNYYTNQTGFTKQTDYINQTDYTNQTESLYPLAIPIILYIQKTELNRSNNSYKTNDKNNKNNVNIVNNENNENSENSKNSDNRKNSKNSENIIIADDIKDKKQKQLLEILEFFSKDSQITNRNPNQIVSVILTGVTALTRQVAAKMDLNGINYPAEKIRDVLLDADITHISNEVSFVEGGNAAKPNTMIFCSRPEYINLLKYIDTDVIELTGNHLNDYGSKWFEYTLDIYDKEGIPYFGGGRNLAESRKPALFEINGTKIAFLGANYFGPSSVWATDSSAGAAPINSLSENLKEDDMKLYEQKIMQLKNEGYNIIFTYQYVETYNYFPTAQQITDFERMVNAGAVIVSGSQAHQPQAVEILDGKFINFGLGNLFFGQALGKEVKQGIIAKHYFYNGKYINTELITTYIEDFCQPRKTEGKERAELLKIIFKNSVIK